MDVMSRWLKRAALVSATRLSCAALITFAGIAAPLPATVAGAEPDNQPVALAAPGRPHLRQPPDERVCLCPGLVCRRLVLDLDLGPPLGDVLEVLVAVVHDDGVVLLVLLRGGAVEGKQCE